MARPTTRKMLAFATISEHVLARLCTTARCSLVHASLLYIMWAFLQYIHIVPNSQCTGSIYRLEYMCIARVLN